MGNFHWPHLPWPDIFPPVEKIPWIAITNGTNVDCVAEENLRHTLLIAVLAAAGFLCALLHVVKWIVDRSIRSVVVPVDLLSVTPFRLAYCLVLSLWASDIMLEVATPAMYYYFAPEDGLIDAVKLFGLTPTVIFLRQSLIYFPLLACVDFTAAPCLGHGIGFLYTLLVGSYKVYVESIIIRGCSYRGSLSWVDILISLISKGPAFIGYLVAAGWFFYRAATEIVLLLFARKKSSHAKDPDRFEGFRDHIRSLLSKPRPRVLKRNRRRNVLQYMEMGIEYVLPYGSTFQYPLALMAPLCMAWFVIYQVVVELMYMEVNVAHRLIHFMDSFNITVEEFSKISDFFNLNATHTIEEFWYDAKSFAESMLIILPFGTAIAFGLLCFFMMYLVQNFHKRMVRIARGDISFIIASEPLPSKPYILAAGMKFCAFQFGYIGCGWIIYTVMECSLLSFGLVFYYLFKDFTFMGIRLWSFFMVPMMWSAGMHTLQLFLCRYVFWKKSEEEGDLIHIRLKSIYHFLAYFFFFFNVMFAVVLSGLRVYTSWMFTIVMYFRIDWDVYMRGLEGWDFGHRTYVGYMYLQYTQNNAVLRTFVQLLECSHRHAPTDGNDKYTAIQNFSRASSASPVHNIGLLADGHANGKSYGTVGHVNETLTAKSAITSDPYTRSRRARNLWLVAYTLIHNPQLRPLTGSQLRLAAEVP